MARSALAIYQECLFRVANPVLTDFLAQMSGDLETALEQFATIAEDLEKRT